MPQKRRQIFAWCMYDWANSAFMTTAASALMPLYFVSIIPAEADALILWGMAATAGSLFIFLFAPLLGSIADAAASKKKFMIFFCYLGCFSSLALVLLPNPGVFQTLFLYFLTTIGLSSSFVFYDAFLPLIAEKKEIDWVSAKGYAYGYIGGGIQFFLSLLLVVFHESIGLTRLEAIRLAIGFSGLWWGGFALVTFWLLEEPKPEIPPEKNKTNFLKEGFSRLLATFRQIRLYRNIASFLLAFMFYNEGIQTIVKMSVIYGKEELGFSDRTLMGTLLVVQFVGAVGAVAMGRLAGYWGTKKTLIGLLIGWTGIAFYAYGMRTELDFWVLGILVALVLGGTQALSRSLYGGMLPKEASGEFFGFFSVFAKLSAIWGPLIFALVRQTTGSAKNGMLVLGGFFLVGILLLTRSRVESS